MDHLLLMIVYLFILASLILVLFAATLTLLFEKNAQSVRKTMPAYQLLPGYIRIVENERKGSQAL